MTQNSINTPLITLIDTLTTLGGAITLTGPGSVDLTQGGTLINTTAPGRFVAFQYFLSSSVYTPNPLANNAVAFIWGAGGGSSGNGNAASTAGGDGGTSTLGSLVGATGGQGGASNSSTTTISSGGQGFGLGAVVFSGSDASGGGILSATSTQLFGQPGGSAP